MVNNFTPDTFYCLSRFLIISRGPYGEKSGYREVRNLFQNTSYKIGKTSVVPQGGKSPTGGSYYYYLPISGERQDDELI